MIKPLSGINQLEVSGTAGRLIPGLLSYGLSLEDATALAVNTANVFFALRKPPKEPRDMLSFYSLEEIADLAQQVRNLEHWDEKSYNEGFLTEGVGEAHK